MKIKASYKTAMQMMFKSVVILSLVLLGLTMITSAITIFADRFYAKQFSVEGVNRMNSVVDDVEYTLVDENTIVGKYESGMTETMHSDGTITYDYPDELDEYDTVLMEYESTSSGVSGLESTIMIFLFVSGIILFKQLLYIGFANGVSRKTTFVTSLLLGASYSVILMIVFYIIFGLGILITSSTNIDMTTSFTSTYCTGEAGAFAFPNKFIEIATGVAFDIFGCISSFASGMFIGGLYYRMNKTLKILVSVGVPVLLFIVAPIIAGYMLSINPELNKIITSVCESIETFFMNPYNMVLANILQTILMGVLTFLLIKKAPIKENIAQ